MDRAVASLDTPLSLFVPNEFLNIISRYRLDADLVFNAVIYANALLDNVSERPLQ